ncbi:SURF1 family protein [Arthrobacter sp. B6]|uniref:SURF1 family protein n=1 Tax=Arthrobacter sp. B6 TaxID=1570137 RepID=UPI00082D48F6|nr:SURF1 family protein [Arthrobacter sp. B6]
MWKTALKPRWIAGLVFAIAVSGVFVLLSQWQFGRSTQPEIPANPATETAQSLTSTLQPGDFFHGSVADQMVTAVGTYDAGKQVLIPGRLNNGESGYWVVTAFAVDGAPVLSGVGASPDTWIPVARGWVADPSQAPEPPSGTVELTGRLLPSEAPVPETAPGPGRATAVSVAELINYWDVSSYPGFITATAEVSAGTDVSAEAIESDLKPLRIGPQPPAQQINWLNLFYSLEWVVFAGFALFIWWRLVKDDYRRDLEDRFDGGEGTDGDHHHLPAHTPSGQTQQKVQP